jgi:cyclic beta-1,2-glucan synthetase
MKTSPPLVLGLYSDPASGTRALQEARQSGYRRSALIQRDKADRVVVQGDAAGWRFPASLVGIALVVVVFASAWLVAAPLLPGKGAQILAGVLVALGALVTWITTTWLDVGIGRRYLAYYRRWVLPGESLVLVQAPLNQTPRVLEALRRSSEPEPATFVMRQPHAAKLPPLTTPPGERFSPERLRLHATYLATTQQVIPPTRHVYPLRARVVESEQLIEVITNDLNEVARLEQSISLIAEWLLDNAYAIRRHSADVSRNLSKRFYDVLPVLESGTHAGDPRIYELALELVNHTEGEVTEGDLVAFVQAYQEVTPLTIGELWVLPLMLEIALIEQLSRLAIEVDRLQSEHEHADFWANRLLTAARQAPDHLLLAVAELARDQPNPSWYVIDRLVSQLQGEAVALEPIRAWLERKLGAPLAEVIQQEQRQHVTYQIAVANAIGSLRELSRLDWREVFERISTIDQILAADPAGVYKCMDFGTRDKYRAVVEQIARRSSATEGDVARLAVELATAAEGDSRRGHVGYYLVAGGRSELEARAGFRPSAAIRARRWALRNPTSLYLASVTTVALAILVAVVAFGGWPAPGNVALVLALLALLPASEIAVQLVNFGATKILPPRPLPKLDFEDGIPDAWRTLVVVPTLFQTKETIKEDLEHLEIRYLGNTDPHLHYALAADFVDAPSEEMPGDDQILDAAVQGIAALNARYGAERFSLFYRPRVKSESEQVWMGWERKRGKLEELNEWLVANATGGQPAATKHHITIRHVGDDAALRDTTFVLTLDADTQLPHGAAHRLVGALAHPLNRPILAPNGERVVDGYALIQPRTSTSLPSATATLFTQFMAGPAGTDPYTMAVSDVYQDLVGEGTYHGKGIYDVHAFQQVLGGRFPEATLLSHDLLEGAYVRVGLASDVELFEQFPSTYRAYAARQHRWIRGDWQIARWATRTVLGPNGEARPNPLSGINRWKILDNQRRSLVAPASIALLLAAWLWPTGPAVAASILVALMVLLPPALSYVSAVITAPESAGVVGRFGQAWRQVSTQIVAALFSLVVLPHAALLAVDAIGRVAYRSWISHRKLLQWQTFRMVHASSARNDGRVSLDLAIVSFLSFAIAIVLAYRNPDALPVAVPFLVLWLICPIVVWRFDQRTPKASAGAMTAADRLLLRRLARQTWRYFDDFVGPKTNWLPPDNYQAALRVEVAPRTSPTNVGLWLLATVAAHDFGYIPLDAVAELGLATLQVLDRLERFEGHLLNWYNVETLQPLPPRYVSTVDSGNFLASLWTLSQAYRELLHQPILSAAVLRGLEDTLELLQSAVLSEPVERVVGDNVTKVSDLAAALGDILGAPAADAADVARRVRAAAGPARDLATLLQARVAAPANPGRRGRPGQVESVPGQEAAYWASQLDRQVTSWLTVIDTYLPGWGGDQKGNALVAAAEFATVGGSMRKGPVHAAKSPTWEQSPAAATAPSIQELASGTSEANLVSQSRAQETAQRLTQLIALIDELASGTNMRFLYDEGRRLFTIGYSVEKRQLDRSYYDLLASEARLASLVSVSRGDVPVEHWFTLGRPFGTADGRLVLLSWTGTMFEYLMPLLLTRNFDQSLLDLACRDAVLTQIDYGNRRTVPWGISEAAFSAVDANQIYQYQAFGVPELGLKRDLGLDLVVAPYATALALMVEPRAAVRNLRRLAQQGAQGAMGFYDSIDYTPRRRPEGQAGILVYTYMAHHQGMTFLSIDNALNGDVMRHRFHLDPRIRASEPLLCERTPIAPPIVEGATLSEVPARPVSGVAAEPATRLRSPDTPTPRTHLLSNSRYTVMVTAAGGGFSRWRDVDVTRWRSDVTLDAWGQFYYLRDLDRGTIWSATHQPICRPAAAFGVTFSPDKAEFERRDAGINALTEIVVSPEDDAEIRRLTLVNLSNRTRRLEVTSYLELALNAHNADRAHPAFSKMFIETAALADHRALLAWRKPRVANEPAVYSAHLLSLPTGVDGEVAYETDRARFLGRGRGPESPVSVDRPLTNTVGSVLDPIFSLRCRLTIEPGERIQLAFVTAAADSRDAVVGLVEKYHDLRATERAFELASFQGQLELRHLRVTSEDVQRFQQLASHMLYPNARLRASEQQLRQNRLGQTRLWAYGISGDLPIMLVTIGNRNDAELVGEALLAHTFWRLRGFKSDLIILDEEAAGYEQPLRDYLRTLVQAHVQYTGLDVPGGIFLRSTDHIPPEDLTLLLAAARVVLVASRGPLAQQLSAPPAARLPLPLAIRQPIGEEPSPPLPFLVLPYFNGVGGFTADGREYATYLGPGTTTPAPWVNVMANPSFGALVSESGQGFTWYGNSQSNRLLPWSNDPVSDPSGDAIYIRDEQSGRYWTPTALPIRELDAYRARHGQGYSVFEHNSHAIEQELTTFVPVSSTGGLPLRIQRLRLRNVSHRRRRLTVTMYAEWVLGGTREETQMHVVSSWDAESQALLARSVYNPDYGSRVAFASASRSISSFTADRTEFLGRNGSVASPAALSRQSLSGRTGADLDSCAALQVTVEIDPGQSADVTFLLGEASDAAQVRAFARRFRDPAQVEDALRETRAYWDQLLGALQVETPELSVDFLLNRWLLYQTLSCRVWGRSALYQSGGAFGFRDQLQDVMALVYSAPYLARQQILVAAARQFIEGDVQHWWHPQSGGGVRTRISDDLLWLPFATAHYVKVTGDVAILDEIVPFLEGHVLDEHEHEAYFIPAVALEVGSLLEHCRRAIARGLTKGPHGLPLIGGGDWNDGLNLVGIGGKGESVWLAWFLVEVLNRFGELLDWLGDTQTAADYRAKATELAEAVEEQAWDGAWYRRAYFDDGTPLGSSENDEAKIDSLPQSWGVISGAARPGRAETAMTSVEEYLLPEKDRLILLFTPPFDNSPLNPGYIKGYPPGVRENGGQYTHGAIWVAMAFARKGDGDEAAKLMRWLNPIERARTPEDVARYAVEPYVVTADIYNLPGRVGRGGWSWYTGSAGWLYRVWIEEILGFKLHGDRLRIDPVIASTWNEFKIRYTYRRTHYEIVVQNPDHVHHGVGWVELDGQRLGSPEIALQDDGGTHHITVRLGHS